MSPSRPLNYHSSPEHVPTREVVHVLFWLAFYVLGGLVTILSLYGFGDKSPAALLMQVLIVLWLMTVFLRATGKRLCYLTAGSWVVLLLLPTAYVLLHAFGGLSKLYSGTAQWDPWVIIFLAISIVTGLLFTTLCLMLVFLLRVQPWRIDRPIGLAAFPVASTDDDHVT
jgi:hypothetical protein